VVSTAHPYGRNLGFIDRMNTKEDVLELRMQEQAMEAK
jgi:hypothetical protein